MESITKNRQPLSTLRAMIASAYGPERVPDDDEAISELSHGWFNVAYRIRLRDGASVVLKIAPPPDVEVMTYERGAMAVELAALELIRSRTTVPVPRVDVATDTYFFMEYIDADNLGMLRDTLTEADRAAYQEALGATTRALNEIRGPGFGPLAGPYSPTWRPVFTRMIESVLTDGERRAVDLGHDYATIRRLIAAHADALEEVTEPRFVEWDLWDNNTLVRDGRIVAVIDHERAFYGDPLIEGGFTGLDLAAYGDPTAFVRGYGRPATFTDGERRRRRLYTLYLVLIMIIETNFRGHTDTRQYDWSRTRLDELLAL